MAIDEVTRGFTGMVIGLREAEKPPRKKKGEPRPQIINSGPVRDFSRLDQQLSHDDCLALAQDRDLKNLLAQAFALLFFRARRGEVGANREIREGVQNYFSVVLELPAQNAFYNTQLLLSKRPAWSAITNIATLVTKASAIKEYREQHPREDKGDASHGNKFVDWVASGLQAAREAKPDESLTGEQKKAWKAEQPFELVTEERANKIVSAMRFAQRLEQEELDTAFRDLYRGGRLTLFEKTQLRCGEFSDEEARRILGHGVAEGLTDMVLKPVLQGALEKVKSDLGLIFRQSATANRLKEIKLGVQGQDQSRSYEANARDTVRKFLQGRRFRDLALVEIGTMFNQHPELFRWNSRTDVTFALDETRLRELEPDATILKQKAVVRRRTENWDTAFGEGADLLKFSDNYERLMAIVPDAHDVSFTHNLQFNWEPQGYCQLKIHGTKSRGKKRRAYMSFVAPVLALDGEGRIVAVSKQFTVAVDRRMVDQLESCDDEVFRVVKQGNRTCKIPVTLGAIRLICAVNKKKEEEGGEERFHKGKFSIFLAVKRKKEKFPPIIKTAREQQRKLEPGGDKLPVGTVVVSFMPDFQGTGWYSAFKVCPTANGLNTTMKSLGMSKPIVSEGIPLAEDNARLRQRIDEKRKESGGRFAKGGKACRVLWQKVSNATKARCKLVTGRFMEFVGQLQEANPESLIVVALPDFKYFRGPKKRRRKQAEADAARLANQLIYNFGRGELIEAIENACEWALERMIPVLRVKLDGIFDRAPIGKATVFYKRTGGSLEYCDCKPPELPMVGYIGHNGKVCRPSVLELAANNVAWKAFDPLRFQADWDELRRQQATPELLTQLIRAEGLR